MTGRTTAVIAAAAALLAATGLLIRPLISSRPVAAPRAASGRAGRPPAVNILAVDAATRALRCPPTGGGASQSRRWCGRFAATRKQIDCPDDQTCRVDLFGTVATAGPRTVIGLTVTLHRDRGGWHVEDVSS